MKRILMTIVMCFTVTDSFAFEKKYNEFGYEKMDNPFGFCRYTDEWEWKYVVFSAVGQRRGERAFRGNEWEGTPPHYVTEEKASDFRSIAQAYADVSGGGYGGKVVCYYFHDKESAVRMRGSEIDRWSNRRVFEADVWSPDGTVWFDNKKPSEAYVHCSTGYGRVRHVGLAPVAISRGKGYDETKKEELNVERLAEKEFESLTGESGSCQIVPKFVAEWWTNKAEWDLEKPESIVKVKLELPKNVVAKEVSPSKAVPSKKIAITIESAEKTESVRMREAEKVRIQAEQQDAKKRRADQLRAELEAKQAEDKAKGKAAKEKYDADNKARLAACAAKGISAERCPKGATSQ